MKNRITALTMLVILAATCCALVEAPATVPPQGLVGTWKWDFNVQDNVITWAATFKQDGDKIVGSAIDGYDGMKLDFKDVKVDKDTVTFTTARTGDFEIHFAFNGKLDGDKITGKCDMKFADNDPMPVDWNAKRAKDSDATTKPAM